MFSVVTPAKSLWPPEMTQSQVPGTWASLGLLLSLLWWEWVSGALSDLLSLRRHQDTPLRQLSEAWAVEQFGGFGGVTGPEGAAEPASGTGLRSPFPTQAGGPAKAHTFRPLAGDQMPASLK